MSSVYLTEPPTNGKVLIKTSQGDIDVELWAREAPLACRNFIQLALEGYYDNTIVHRIVKDFMVQMGDPTGTGTGGQSIWGRPFKDEIHSRIKFNHRGQLAMANLNKPNTNLSQFFFTLDACEWLNRKHTIFGKVTGNTIFNLTRIGEVDVDANDRPVDEIKVLSIEVLLNPFDDIVPRNLVVAKKTEKNDDDSAQAHRKKRKATKDLKLLSFGEEENDDEEEFTVKVKSSHDSKHKDKRFSSKVANELKNVQKLSEKKQKVSTDPENNLNSVDYDKEMREKILQQFNGVNTKNIDNKKELIDVDNDDEDVEVDKKSILKLQQQSNDSKRADSLKEKSKEFSKLKQDLLRSRRAVNVLTGAEAEKVEKESAHREMLPLFEQRRLKYLKRKEAHGSRADETLAKLQQFTSTLRKEKSKTSDTVESRENKSPEVESYHGQILEQEDEEEDLEGWYKGKLKFKKHIDDAYRAGNNVSADDRSANDYDIVDPRK